MVFSPQVWSGKSTELPRLEGRGILGFRLGDVMLGFSSLAPAYLASATL